MFEQLGAWYYTITGRIDARHRLKKRYMEALSGYEIMVYKKYKHRAKSSGIIDPRHLPKHVIALGYTSMLSGDSEEYDKWTVEEEQKEGVTYSGTVDSGGNVSISEDRVSYTESVIVSAGKGSVEECWLLKSVRNGKKKEVKKLERRFHRYAAIYDDSFDGKKCLTRPSLTLCTFYSLIALLYAALSYFFLLGYPYLFEEQSAFHDLYLYRFMGVDLKGMFSSVASAFSFLGIRGIPPLIFTVGIVSTVLCVPLVCMSIPFGQYAIGRGLKFGSLIVTALCWLSLGISYLIPKIFWFALGPVLVLRCACTLILAAALCYEIYCVCGGRYFGYKRTIKRRVKFRDSGFEEVQKLLDEIQSYRVEMIGVRGQGINMHDWDNLWKRDYLRRPKPKEEIQSLSGQKKEKVQSLSGQPKEEIQSLPGQKKEEIQSLPGQKKEEIQSLPGQKKEESV